jgi:diguanylate cyclase (GGDEF)-like protein
MLDHLYLPEPLTFVTILVLVILLACVNYLVIWFQNRKETSLPWMAAAALISGSGLYLRATLPEPQAIFLGVPAIVFGIGCVWTSCRLAAGWRPSRIGILLSAVAWPVLCVVSGQIGQPRGRTAIAYGISAAFLCLALRAVWAPSRPRRPGHWFVVLLLASETLVCAVWAICQILTMMGRAHFGPPINIPFSAFSLTGFHLLMSYAFVAWAKERAELAGRAEAYRDALTGIGNRRQLDTALAEAVTLAQRRQHGLAVIMIDIDHFKAYNDHYGHPAGDACLRAVAQCLAETITHPEDEVMRYGGEEFTVLLRRAGAEAALGLAERMRAAVRAMSVPHAGQDSGMVTVSLGVAAMTADLATPAALIAAADRALYRAKESGRDRAELFAPIDAIRFPLEQGRVRASEGLRADVRSPGIKI